MMALYHRDLHGGTGQLVDVNLVEPLARLIETSTLAYSHLGIVPGRTGNRLDASAPRNAYRTADGRWVALVAASRNIVMRLYHAVDRPDLAEDEDYVDPIRRQAHGDEIDEHCGGVDQDARALGDVMRVFEDADVAAAPVYDAEQLLADTHFAGPRVRSSSVDDPDLGSMTVQAPVAPPERDAGPGRVSRTRPSGPTTTRSTAPCSASTPEPASPRCGTPGPSEPTSRGAACAHHEPDVRSWPHRRAASACARRRPSSGADLVFLDLEDACAPSAKEAARSIAVGALDRAGLGPDRPCRPHQRASTRRGATGTSLRSSRALVTASTSSLCPKVRRAPCNVWWVDVLLTQLETKLRLTCPIGLEVLIDEAGVWPTRSRSPRPASVSKR